MPNGELKTTAPSIHRGCMLFNRWRALDATWWRKLALRDRLQLVRDGTKREFLPTRWYRGSAASNG